MGLADKYNLKKDLKWMVVLGGNLSGIGKGIVTASIGKLLSSRMNVIPVKCDGYYNVDPGTIHPRQHGEVFVLDDGGEVDMDFGHYERFISKNCKFEWNLTMGKINHEIFQKERRGDYLGETIQTIPHVTNLIKDKWFKIAKKEKADVMLIEIGGTIGDIENQLYIEAANQLSADFGRNNIFYSVLTYVPVLKGVDEQKSKLVQSAVRELRELGIYPDLIVARCDRTLNQEMKQKIAQFCHVGLEEVISSHYVRSVYELPQSFDDQGLTELITKKLGISTRPDLEQWNSLVKNLHNPKNSVEIAICGKYTKLKDSYASINEALKHAGANLSAKVNLRFIDTRELDKNCSLEARLKGIDGIIIPGGFSTEGVEGKIKCVEHARRNKIPFLGICYGLQMAVIEYARNVCGLGGANTTEVNKETPHPVVTILESQKRIKNKGGTMRLGSYPALLKEGTIARTIYDADKAYERHRHRFEVNPKYHGTLIENGMVISGISPSGKLAEFIELPKEKHPYFIATQAHPELKSRLEKPAPLFYGLVKAALEYKNSGKMQ